MGSRFISIHGGWWASRFLLRILFSKNRYGPRGQALESKAKQVQAIAYMRTSSAANVGEDKDSSKRQLAAIETYAKRAGIEIVGSYYDAAVKGGGDPIERRDGFAAMLKRIEGNGVRTIIVETANRFARDLMVQEVGFRMLQARGIGVIAADSPTAFLDDTPTANLIRQVLGAVSEFEKAMIVAKLRGARERKRKTGVKVEGRKSIGETRPEVVEAARKLARATPKGGKPSLRDVSAGLAAAGYLTGRGTPFAPTAVANMLARGA
ncbi:recombinase family protein [Lichenibacterium ramalinae]|uniref:Recombinase family protein n=1 Tax=Lichenibacterium ramalinae TaxID=2316527 RepID=A0A4Q2R7G7_9HYPH|nr:recombinase family protein [Lichenibacterium ramalinae]